MQEGYHFDSESILLGGAIFNGTLVPNCPISIPLSTLNRHGLIAGATGTGKTKTIQRFAEALSNQGISTLLMDIKGDISGIAKPGNENSKITERMKLLGVPWHPEGYPTELMSIPTKLDCD